MHLVCEDCGGPENWCLDRAGDVWVRCMDDSCRAQQQELLWPEEPIWPEGVADALEGDDQEGSGCPDPSDVLIEIRSIDPSF